MINPFTITRNPLNWRISNETLESRIVMTMNLHPKLGQCRFVGKVDVVQDGMSARVDEDR